MIIMYHMNILLVNTERVRLANKQIYSLDVKIMEIRFEKVFKSLTNIKGPPQKNYKFMGNIS